MKNPTIQNQARLFEENVAIIRYQVAESQDENEKLKSDIRRVEEQIAKLQSEVIVKDDQIKRLRHAHSRYLSRLENGGSSHAEDVARLEAYISELLSSTSWRVTKPLRWLKIMLRRG